MKYYYKITKVRLWPWMYKLSCAKITPSCYDSICNGSLKHCHKVLQEIKDGKRNKYGIWLFATAEIEFKD